MSDRMQTRRREFLKAAGAAAIGAPAAAPAIGERLNLLFVMADQYSPHAAGFAGNTEIRTPNLDRLARQGTIFDTTYCAYPLCVPARQSILTGKYPHSMGVYGNEHVLNAGETTIADRFRQFGYRTLAVGKMHWQDDHALHGFERHVQYGNNEGAAIMPEIKGDPRFAADQALYAQIQPIELRGGPAFNWAEDSVTEFAKNWLRTNGHQPFCLWVSYGLPHWHWVCAPEFYYMYDPKRVSLPASFRDDLSGSPYARRISQQRGFWGMTEEQTRLCRARFFGATTALDHYVGRLLDEVEKLGLTRKTLVVFTADHGEMAGEHKLWDKTVFYEASARVPCLMRLPGAIPAGRRASALLSHIDLFPSLCRLCGVDPGNHAEGQDCSSMIRGASQESREYLFSESQIGDDGAPGAVMVRWRNWSYMQYRNDPAELYDLDSDPDQMKNLAGRGGTMGIAGQLRAKVGEWINGRQRAQFPIRTIPPTHPLTRPRTYS